MHKLLVAATLPQQALPASENYTLEIITIVLPSRLTLNYHES